MRDWTEVVTDSGERWLWQLGRPVEGLPEGEVHEGWALTVAGECQGCGWDPELHLLEELPAIANGEWEGRPVLDGPNPATWVVAP